MTRALSICTAILALSACSPGTDLPVKPQLKLDRDSLGFGQEFGSGTYVGTMPMQNLKISNGGQQALTLTSAELSGPDAAAFTKSGPGSNTLKSGEDTFIQFVFAPTQARLYSATLTIVSNAENAPSKTVAVTGKGIDIASIALNPTCAADGGSCPQVQVGMAVAFAAIATFSDAADGGPGTTQNVNSISTWTSSDNSVATIDSTGNATGLTPGTTTITATAHSVSGSTTLTVHN